MAETDLRQSYNPSMNSGKTVAGRVDGTGEIEGSTRGPRGPKIQSPLLSLDELHPSALVGYPVQHCEC